MREIERSTVERLEFGLGRQAIWIQMPSMLLINLYKLHYSSCFHFPLCKNIQKLTGLDKKVIVKFLAQYLIHTNVIIFVITVLPVQNYLLDSIPIYGTA